MAEFFVDHDVAFVVAAELHALGHQAFTARDQGDGAESEAAHLWTAAANGWTVVSHNTADWRLLHLAWTAWAQQWGTSQTHAGILIIPHGMARESARLVSELVASGVSPGNCMYEYHPVRGWVAWP